MAAYAVSDWNRQLSVALGKTPMLLRPGGIPCEQIVEITGLLADAKETKAPVAPGQLQSHYAPSAKVRLNAKDTISGEALLAFGADVPGHDGPIRNLSPTGDLVEAAAHLFAYLHELDATDAHCIAVMPVPETGLGLAINDRLARAAAGR